MVAAINPGRNPKGLSVPGRKIDAGGKILKALAIKGIVNAQYLFNQVPPGRGTIAPRIIRKFGIQVTDSGIIMVARKRAKMKSRPSELYPAKSVPGQDGGHQQSRQRSGCDQDTIDKILAKFCRTPGFHKVLKMRCAWKELAIDGFTKGHQRGGEHPEEGEDSHQSAHNQHTR